MFIYIVFVVRSFLFFEKSLFSLRYSTSYIYSTFPVTGDSASEVCITIYVSQLHAIHDYVGINL
jgi:hypothetical protein